jgi:hypothetical protein
MFFGVPDASRSLGKTDFDMNSTGWFAPINEFVGPVGGDELQHR